MAGTPQPVPEENHGWKGALFALVFALLIVGGASAATAHAVDQNGGDPDKSGSYEDDHSDDAEGDDYSS